jgi:hypothetical protein
MRWDMYINIMRERARIDFYGKVVDEQGKPLRDVDVRVRVRKPNWAFIVDPANTLIYREYRLRTDANGRFELRGESGSALDVIDLKLPKYRFSPRIIGGGNWETSFYYAGAGVGDEGPHKADPQNPIIFKMMPTK